MKIQYIDAPAGSGKTRALCQIINDGVRKGQKVILVQPTKHLIDQTYKTLSIDMGLQQQVRKIYSLSQNAGSTINSIVSNFKNPPHGGTALLITQAAFEMVPYFEKAGQWDLIFDECPTAEASFNFRVPHSHALITDHLEIGSELPYASVTANFDLKEDILKLGAKDEIYRRFYPVAQRVSSNGWDTYVDVAHHQRLLGGDIATLTVYAVRNKQILSRFKSCTVASARFLESLFYKIMRENGVSFQPYPLKPKALRYTAHQNGSLLTIYYMGIDRWSKKAAEEHPDLVTNLKQTIQFKFHGHSFIYLGNKGSGHYELENAGGLELGGNPHGLNQYQHIDRAAIFPAYNPRPAHAKFLASLGISSEDLDIAMHCNAVYQALMRCSLRDPNSKTQKVAIVPDKRTANWLSNVFPGATVKEIPVSNIKSVGVVGRPPKYANNAAKMKAYRQRKKSEAMGRQPAPVLDTASLATPDRYETIKGNSNFVTPAASQPSEIMRMNAYTTVKSTGADAIIPIYSIADLLDIMIYFQQKTIKSKEEQILYNFTNFDCDPKLSRKLENATGTSALILDNDGDGISYKEFMLTFQKCKMIISNTFSSTGMRERWRVIIPLARTVSVDEHDQLYALVLAELQKAGYPLDKRDPSRPYDQSHGFDTSKRTIVSIVYLPSQAKDPQGSFFEAAIGADREIFDPDAWLSCLPPVPAPSVVSSLPKSAPAATTAGNKLDGAIKEWRSVGCLPGQGNQGFKKLAIAAHRAGLSEREITDLLEQQAAFANSPEDRRKEIGSLISWMKVKLQR